jgi:histidyl-tRNA synthetase
MKLKKCKGFRDILPQDMSKFRRVEATFREACIKAGYQEIRTPTLEYLYLFTSAGTLTPGMLRRVYSFLDWDGWSGERVVLRPDATIPAVRLYLEHFPDASPRRLNYVTNTFIFEETGLKSRERWQCGVELLGTGGEFADAELVTLIYDVLRALGIGNLTLNLSHAGLIRAAISELGLPLTEQHRLFDIILDSGEAADKDVKIENTRALEAIRLLFNTKGENSGYLKNMRALSSSRSSGYISALDNFIQSFELIEQLGIKCEIDMASGKGFEYYTGLIFRIDSGEENLGGGGRYDQLATVMGGNPTAAAGFALYMDRLMALLPLSEEDKKRIAVVCSADTFKKATDLVYGLREAGYIAGLELASQMSTGYSVQVNPAGGYMVVSHGGEAIECTSISDVTKRLGRL